MCRFFGFQATRNTNIRFSLVHAENALRVQSMNNPDGWGIGFYQDDMAKTIKRPIAAGEDTTFLQLCDFISSRTVIAHVRKASVGSVTRNNCHPFQYHNWIFAHNGTWERAEKNRNALMDFLPENLRGEVQGNSDSELCFFAFLGMLQREFHIDLLNQNIPDEVLVQTMAATIKFLDQLSQEAQAERPSRFNFLVSNGHTMLATRRGAPLFSLQRHEQSDATGMWARTAGQDGLMVSLGVTVDEEESGPVQSVLIASEPVSPEEWRGVTQDTCLLITANANVEQYPLHSLSDEQCQQMESYIQAHIKKPKET